MMQRGPVVVSPVTFIKSETRPAKSDDTKTPSSPFNTFAAAYLLEAAFLPAGLLLLGAGWAAALLTLICMGGLVLLALKPLPGRRAWPSSRRV